MPTPEDWSGHAGNTGFATDMDNAIRAGRDPDEGQTSSDSGRKRVLKIQMMYDTEMWNSSGIPV